MLEQHFHALIFAAFSLFGFWGAFHNLKKARAIEDTPTSKIRSASQGYCELSGFAKQPDQIIVMAPLTGQFCLWYSYTIERYERRGKSSSWRTVESKTSAQIFLLDDETGRCVVYPQGADVSSHRRDRWHGSTRRPIGGFDKSGGFLGMGLGRYRYTEHRIHEDDYLYALGMFETAATAIPAERAKDTMVDLLVEWKDDYDKLLAEFDANSDGELDMDEWESVRGKAYREAYQEALKNHKDSPIDLLVKPPKGKPHLISNKDPKQLASGYRWKARGLALLFVIMAGVTVFLMIQPAAQ